MIDLEEIYKLDSDEEIDLAMDKVLETIDDLLLQNRLSAVDEILNSVDIERPSITLMLVFLVSALAAKEQLSAYKELYNRAKDRLDRTEPQRSAALLSGLEP